MPHQNASVAVVVNPFVRRVIVNLGMNVNSAALISV